jgi:kynureninase
MPATTDVHHAHDLDRGDPLAEYRDRFLGADTPLVYFDGNSLGRPLAVTPDHLATFVREDWGGRLIRGWDEQWFDQPLVLGDELGRITLGAAPGQTAIGDSTTVLLYKLARAAVDAQLARDPRRTEIVVDTDNFPTDRYLVEGIAGERGLTIRWIDVDRSAGVTAEQLAAVVGPATGLVLLSHVAYRSAYVADGPGLTRIAHDAGALVLWDLSHSVGSVPLALDEWGADLATGCGYKYLNGGPGAPAFAYVATRLQAALTQPIMGWMGHAEPFLMGPGYRPAVGMRRFLSGTPAIVDMTAPREM